jgi:two-component system capsular synthesis response regulator RcsB
VIDDHPLVRLGVRGVLGDDFEVHESVSREEALELVRDIGDFDVTIVDMRWRQNGAAASISGAEAIRMLRRSSPGIGIVAHGERPERHTANVAIQAGASAYVSRTAGTAELRRAVDAAAAQESFVDPSGQPRQANPPPARDPAAPRRRRIDHRRGARTRPQRRDGQDPHQDRPGPTRRQEPDSRGVDCPARVADRLTRGARSSRSREP